MLESVQTIAIFQKQPDPKEFLAGEVIFEEGQLGEYMYGILEGSVDICINGKIVETIQAGDAFGIGVLVGIENRTYTAIANTNCKLASLDKYRFLFAVQETPVFALEIMKSYSQRLNRLGHKI